MNATVLQLAQRIQPSWRRLAIGTSLVGAAGVALCCDEKNQSADVASCEGARQPAASKIGSVGAAPSKWRQCLYHWHLYNLPRPPRHLAKQDPALSLTRRQIKQRAMDDAKQQAILQQISNKVEQFQLEDQQNDHNPAAMSHAVQESRQKEMGTLQQAWLDIVYGPGVTLKDRQDFLERFGCTGWTEHILFTLLEVAGSRGFVEIGAGNGQWARILTDRYEEVSTDTSSSRPKQFDFVLAYDDGSRLPLNPEVYHSKTQPNHLYFYSKVQPLHADSVESTVKQWPCRGRVLLLVYPPAGSDMALQAVKAYDETPTVSAKDGSSDKIVVYVGEGRGGANANDAFFDHFEQNEWILDRILPVKSFGINKGYEQLFIFRKQP